MTETIDKNDSSEKITSEIRLLHFCLIFNNWSCAEFSKEISINKDRDTKRKRHEDMYFQVVFSSMILTHSQKTSLFHRLLKENRSFMRLEFWARRSRSLKRHATCCELLRPFFFLQLSMLLSSFSITTTIYSMSILTWLFLTIFLSREFELTT